MTRRSTRTMTVLSQASDTTTPCRTRFGICSFLFLRSGGGGFDAPGALAQDGLDPRDIAPHLTHSRRILELAARPLEAQVEGFLAEIVDLLLQLVDGLRSDIAGLHAATFSPIRATKRG